jgi:hypothetical protein
MANVIQQFLQRTFTWAFGVTTSDVYEDTHIARQSSMSDLISYYNGQQRKPLRITQLGKDYNVITNHSKTIVDRSVSMLMGAGVEFDLPGEGESEQDAIIDLVWDANKKDVLLHDLAQFGSIYGTMALKIIPGGKVSMSGTVTDRLVALNPYNLTIYSAQDDIENIIGYVYRWNAGEVAWRELTQKQENGTWLVTVQKLDKTTAGKWQNEGEPILFTDKNGDACDFAPIIHGKNLPNAGSIYGTSDIEGIIDLQDKYNEAMSNVNKILGLQAWAQKYIIGGKFPRFKDANGNEYLDVGPDKALEISNETAKIGILQPSGDLTSSREFTNDIRRDMFDIAATVDADTVKDKIGALTNFGLRVLFKNEIAKNATKQLLYGDLLLSVNNRILQLAGYKGEDANPGAVEFGDPLPTNDIEAVQTLTNEKALGIVSQETIAKKRGYDWENEVMRLEGEKKAASNVGSNLIRDFLAGKGQ